MGKKQIHKKTGSYLINNRFNYNIRGWTNHQQSQASSDTLFDKQLMYNQNSANPLFNGNLTADYNKKINHIIYNHLNLPTLIDLGNNKIMNFSFVPDVLGQALIQKKQLSAAISFIP